MRIDFEAGASSGGGDGTWGEDGGWWGDGDVDLQAMGKSLEWDLRGLVSADATSVCKGLVVKLVVSLALLKDHWDLNRSRELNGKEQMEYN
uniref:Uncharacterized protein n=1 Tax=Fagus sylvatica TaxID=28930 RepID=A0A2N9HRF2_FAGSY